MNIKLFKNNQGVSLPIIIGLILLLFIISVAVNELIVKNMRAMQRIEYSNRAYLAAEAGLEDALYELTPHSAGYETRPISGLRPADPSFRRTALDDKSQNSSEWYSEWSIASISNKNTWETRKMYKNKNLVLSLFDDISRDNGLMKNEIYEYTIPIGRNTDIKPLTSLKNDFNITFKIPDADKIFTSGENLRVDNNNNGTANEYPDSNDGDSADDIFISWKLTDGTTANTLKPKQGCLGGIGTLMGSNICESDFNRTNGNYSVKLDYLNEGVRSDNMEIEIGDFIEAVMDTPNAKLYFVFTIEAPMEHTHLDNSKVSIPYIDYVVGPHSTDQIPYPEFTIKSVGYYKNAKQVITATVVQKIEGLTKFELEIEHIK